MGSSSPFTIDLLTIPPGFSEGVSSSIPASVDQPSSEPQDPIGISELLFTDDDALLAWAGDTSTKKPAEQTEEPEKPVKVRIHFCNITYNRF